jgi:hypothetical protein
MQSYSFFYQTTPGADFIMFSERLPESKQDMKTFSHLPESSLAMSNKKL